MLVEFLTIRDLVLRNVGVGTAIKEVARCALHIIERGGHFGVFDTPMTDDDEPALYPEEVVAATGAIADFLASVLFD